MQTMLLFLLLIPAPEAHNWNVKKVPIIWNWGLRLELTLFSQAILNLHFNMYLGG